MTQTYIFTCVHNAGRSQMAAAFFNQLADFAKVRAVSAGTGPGPRVQPEVLEAMREVGIDLSNAQPQLLTEELARNASLLITMGCGERCPVAFYSDKHSVFRMNRDASGGQGMTQFGRALAELNIEILCANSSQAKGRVERANRTLQDRLVKELRLAEISSVEAGNDFLPAFMERFNERFAVVPAKPDNLHRKVHLPTSRLTDILCHREQRYLSAQLSFHYDRKQIILQRNKISEELAGKYVDLYEYADGQIEVRWKGVSLPYRVFHKDQRVSQTAIVENKRLSHALSLVKAQQELKRETKVLTNSEKDGYKKRPRSVYGPDYIENALAPKTVEMTG